MGSKLNAAFHLHIGFVIGLLKVSAECLAVVKMIKNDIHKYILNNKEMKIY